LAAVCEVFPEIYTRINFRENLASKAASHSQEEFVPSLSRRFCGIHSLARKWQLHETPTMNYKASDIDGSWATNALHETIKEFNEQTSLQTKQMLRLTRVMAWLTFVMLVGLAVQIYLAIWPPTASLVPCSIPPLAARQSVPIAAAPPLPSNSITLPPGASQPLRTASSGALK
jgi:hypothetical protein